MIGCQTESCTNPMEFRFVPFVATLLSPATGALAQRASESSDAAPPLPLTRLTWPGIVVIIILALFLTAAIVGPLIRANTREELD
jgi:hypothetical protein